MSGLRRERWPVVGPYLDRALEMADDARTAWLEALRAEDPGLARELGALLDEGRALSREGFLEGVAPLRPPVSLAGQTVGGYRDDWRIGVPKSVLGAALTTLGRYDEAESLLLDAQRVLRDIPGAQGQEARATQARLVALNEARSRAGKTAPKRASAPQE